MREPRESCMNLRTRWIVAGEKSAAAIVRRAVVEFSLEISGVPELVLSIQVSNAYLKFVIAG